MAPKDLSGINPFASALPIMEVDCTILPYGNMMENRTKVMKLRIELLQEFKRVHTRLDGTTYMTTDQSFSLQLTVENVDGTVGVHQRGLSGFDPDKYNAIWLVAHALAQFTDVMEKQ